MTYLHDGYRERIARGLPPVKPGRPISDNPIWHTCIICPAESTTINEGDRLPRCDQHEGVPADVTREPAVTDRLAELRALALAADVKPVRDPAELARMSVEAHVRSLKGPDAAPLPEQPAKYTFTRAALVDALEGITTTTKVVNGSITISAESMADAILSALGEGAQS